MSFLKSPFYHNPLIKVLGISKILYMAPKKTMKILQSLFEFHISYKKFQCPIQIYPFTKLARSFAKERTATGLSTPLSAKLLASTPRETFVAADFTLRASSLAAFVCCCSHLKRLNLRCYRGIQQIIKSYR